MKTDLQEVRDLKQQAKNVLEDLKKLKKACRDIKGDVQFRISMDFLDSDFEIIEKLLERSVGILKVETLKIVIEKEQ